MSMHLNFEPHSWYMGAAIQLDPLADRASAWKWTAHIEDGTRLYGVIELGADTLSDLKRKVKDYREGIA